MLKKNLNYYFIDKIKETLAYSTWNTSVIKEVLVKILFAVGIFLIFYYFCDIDIYVTK